MSNSRYTPGPWHAVIWPTVREARKDGAFRWLSNEEAFAVFPGPVGEVFQGTSSSHTGLPGYVEVSAANARLIAAAPDLLATCEDVLCWLRVGILDDPRGAIRVLSEAIAKAR